MSYEKSDIRERAARIVIDQQKAGDQPLPWPHFSEAVSQARSQLDPDIEACRSWSGYQKLRAQTNRNYRIYDRLPTLEDIERRRADSFEER